jgi:hypothetical protein
MLWIQRERESVEYTIQSQFAHMNNIMLCYPELEFPFDTAQVNLRFWKAIHYRTLFVTYFEP